MTKVFADAIFLVIVAFELQEIDTMVKSMQQSTDNTSDMTVTAPAEIDNQYMTGLKLYTTLSALTVVGFLMLLDVSVVATVNRKSCGNAISHSLITAVRLFQKSPPTSTR